MKTVTGQTVYEASDGKRFLTQIACEAYEANVLTRVQAISYFIVRHNPDIQASNPALRDTTRLAIEHECATAVAIDWCYENCGHALQFLRNGTPVVGWKLSVGSQELWPDTGSVQAATVGERVADVATEVPVMDNTGSNMVFLSVNGDLDGFPEHHPIRTS